MSYIGTRVSNGLRNVAKTSGCIGSEREFKVTHEKDESLSTLLFLSPDKQRPVPSAAPTDTECPPTQAEALRSYLDPKMARMQALAAQIQRDLDDLSR